LLKKKKKKFKVKFTINWMKTLDNWANPWVFKTLILEWGKGRVGVQLKYPGLPLIIPTCAGELS